MVITILAFFINRWIANSVLEASQHPAFWRAVEDFRQAVTHLLFHTPKPEPPLTERAHDVVVEQVLQFRDVISHYPLLISIGASLAGVGAVSLTYALVLLLIRATRAIAWYVLYGIHAKVYPIAPRRTGNQQEAAQHFMVVQELPRCQVMIVRKIEDRFYTVAQAFFTKAGSMGDLYDELLTAGHAFQDFPVEDFYIVRGASRPVRVVEVLPVDNPPLTDAVTFRVPRGTASRLGAAPAQIATSVLPRTPVVVSAGGLREGSVVLQSTGTISPSPTKGVYICCHSANTEPGFSGAPIMAGTKVVALHTSTLSGKINSGYWIYPILGKVVDMTMTAMATEAARALGEYRAESSEDGMAWLRDAAPRVEMHDDMVFVQGEDGRFHNFKANQRQQADIRSKIETVWGPMNDPTPRAITTLSGHSFPAVNFYDSDREVDFGAQLSWEQRRALAAKWGFTQPSAGVQQGEAAIPRPTTNLDPEVCNQAVAAFARVLDSASTLRNAFDITAKAGGLALAQRNEQ